MLHVVADPKDNVSRNGDLLASRMASGTRSDLRWIDFGVTPEGRTVLVEVNDAYSLGHVGLRPVPYANMLEDRWMELITKRQQA